MIHLLGNFRLLTLFHEIIVIKTERQFFTILKQRLESIGYNLL